MNRTPQMLELSSWLETPTGHYASYSAVSIIPAAAAILAVVDRPEAAMKMTAVAILFVGSSVAGVFWICGKSLTRVINESIEMKKKRGEAQDGDDGNEDLLAARTKIGWTVGFITRQMILMDSILVFAIFSKYGTAAPLLLFDTPMVIITMVKHVIAVQLFSGRSKLNAPPRLRYYIGRRLGVRRKNEINVRIGSCRNGQIAPIENFPALNHTLVEETQQIHGG